MTDAKGRTWCTTHFKPLVRTNEVVKVGAATDPVAVYPMPGVDVTMVPIYATVASTATHTTEPGMFEVGTVHIKVDKASKFLKIGRQSSDDYKIELRFRFGTAEMQVQAYDVTNDREICVEFTFASEAAGAEQNCHVTLPGVGS